MESKGKWRKRAKRNNRTNINLAKRKRIIRKTITNRNIRKRYWVKRTEEKYVDP